MKKLSNTEDELKKTIAYPKRVIKQCLYIRSIFAKKFPYPN